MSDARAQRLWLIGKSGALQGRRFEVRGPVYRVGSDVHNDLVMEEEGVRDFHVEVHARPEGFELVPLVHDLPTLLNGKPVGNVLIADGDLLALGIGGPRLAVKSERLLVSGIAEPIEVPELVPGEPKQKGHDTLIAEAVAMARLARGAEGASGQTTTIMRDLVLQALHKTKKTHRKALLVLVSMLVLVIAASLVAVFSVRREKAQIDTQITRLESQLQTASDPAHIDQILAELESYEVKARDLQRSMLYELGVRDREKDFLEGEIRVLLESFGAERYAIPTEFVEQVRTQMTRYLVQDRRHVERVLQDYGEEMVQIRQVLAEYNVPPDLAYMILVESAFIEKSRSRAGAAGIWQFMPPTARSYGLIVNSTTDERFDVDKSTHAAARYLRDLILEFGSGHSVMLALAAYNTGPTRVRREVRKIKDPIRQRNFWYLYRTRALPKETREYVPKIFAALIIGRNPEKFGFTHSIAI